MAATSHPGIQHQRKWVYIFERRQNSSKEYYEGLPERGQMHFRKVKTILFKSQF